MNEDVLVSQSRLVFVTDRAPQEGSSTTEASWNRKCSSGGILAYVGLLLAIVLAFFSHGNMVRCVCVLCLCACVCVRVCVCVCVRCVCVCV
jgi:hypothetical protein